MTALVDTNILVYNFDRRFPAKQRVAAELLRAGIANDTLRVPHQALLEFVSAVTRSSHSGSAILAPLDALHEAEEMLHMFEVLYPNAALYRLALRGATAYQLSWFDAHLWAYAEHYGLDTLYSEDFQHERRYGSVLAINPFAEIASES